MIFWMYLWASFWTTLLMMSEYSEADLTDSPCVCLLVCAVLGLLWPMVWPLIVLVRAIDPLVDRIGIRAFFGGKE